MKSINKFDGGFHITYFFINVSFSMASICILKHESLADCKCGLDLGCIRNLVKENYGALSGVHSQLSLIGWVSYF